MGPTSRSFISRDSYDDDYDGKVPFLSIISKLASNSTSVSRATTPRLSSPELVLPRNERKSPKSRCMWLSLRQARYSRKRIILFLFGIATVSPVLFVFISALIPTSGFRMYKGSGIDYPVPQVQFDRQFTARNNGNSFDVVASIYKEDLGGLKKFVDGVRRLPQLEQNAELDFRVYIYTKDEKYLNKTPDASSSRSWYPSFSIPGAQIIVRPLPNIGREGHTYLHHILAEWSSLANHTLFTQAVPHEPHNTLSRISKYYSPTLTGFIGLGMEWVLCLLSRCRDPYGWEDVFNHLPQVYTSVYGVIPEEGTDVHLEYKGQFIASARRIRGVRKSVYEGWKSLLEDGEDSWVHEDKRLGKFDKHKFDSTSNPVIGHTLERSWGLLMQCGAKETGIWKNCEGKGWWKLMGDRLGDCQCLDN